ncbi:ATP-binding protein [Desulfospira joergensenii]|uniref:ATP-binding protein n=1 Tax=Desulfospira joergensenii TaxID=53329 RepID=UPI0003B34398|nr:ATP-binding protein [Desulfospira joergensenii]
MLSKSWPADLSSLERLQAFIEEWGSGEGLSSETKNQLNLLLEEIVVNIVNYAYQDPSGQVFNIDIKTTPEEIQICISDSGLPFNPLEAEDPDLSSGVEDRPVGGLGIFFVKQFTTHAAYERRDNKNYLTLTVAKGK